ncbi:MAG: DUF357 domain-containing protein [Nanoarchaeota archaeon]
MKIQDKITKQKIEKYAGLTSRALAIAKNSIAKSKEIQAKEIILMVECYLSDAKHFEKNNNYVNAFACLNYAHGWLDSGARLKIFNVTDNKLFTV